MAGYYDKNPNRDYSKEIANTKDYVKRSQLQTERQNKMDALDLNGRVPSNQLVSTWSAGNTPGGWDSPSQAYKPLSSSADAYRNAKYSVDALYEQADNQRMKALEDARLRNRQALESSLNAAKAEFDNAATSAQVNSRITALGNEEKLADMGLSQGAYSTPSSGYTESSRISLDNALKQDLNNIQSSRASANATLRSNAQEIDNALSLQASDDMAKMAMEKAQSLYNFYKDEKNYELNKAQLIGIIDGLDTLDRTNQRQSNEIKSAQLTGVYGGQQTLDSMAQKQNYALNEAKLTGYLKGNETLDRTIMRQNYERNKKLDAQKYTRSIASANAKSAAAQSKADENAYKKALERWKIFGRVFPEDSAILGIAQNTLTASQKNEEARSRLERENLEYRKRGY